MTQYTLKILDVSQGDEFRLWKYLWYGERRTFFRCCCCPGPCLLRCLTFLRIIFINALREDGTDEVRRLYFSPQGINNPFTFSSDAS